MVLNTHTTLFCRTKVECAGLCLSINDCSAFQFITGPFSCYLYKKDGACQLGDADLIELYVEENMELPPCPGIEVYKLV